MRIIFFGTSIFAIPSLKALAESSHEVLLVVTQPDRKKGRHLNLKPPAVKEVASSLNIPIFQPERISGQEAIERLTKMNADLFVVVSFGQILSQKALLIPKKFSVNLHASLLPKYRGAAPINWAIVNGERKTGATVFRLVERMDEGDIIAKEEVDIKDTDTAITLSKKSSQIGARLLVTVVDLIDKNKAVLTRQDERLTTFAPKLKKEDGLINWNLSAVELHNRTRGFLPWPSAFTYFNGKRLKVLKTKACRNEKSGDCGQVAGIEPDLGILVHTKEGCLAIQKRQLEGSRPMAFDEFLRGHKLKVGGALG